MSVLIVVVDDDSWIRKALSSVLAEEGYRVVCATDGASALVLAQHSLPNLIVSDLAMPGLDGLGLLAAVRADPVLGPVPFLIFSANACEESVLAGSDMNASFLAKPAGPVQILGAVRSALS